MVGQSRLTLAFLVLLLACAACGGPQASIVGKWQQVDGDAYMEFYKDGTYVGSDMGLTVTGSYRFIDDRHIRIEVLGLFGLLGPQVYEVEMSGNRLSLKDSYGQISEYSRVE